MTSGWSFWIDRGGTFTDVVARDPRGTIHVSKLLSEDPEHYADAPLEAISRLLGAEDAAPQAVDTVRMGTTVATNALLERAGAAVCLVTTAGLEDLLEIGTQDRPDLFALNIVKPGTLAKAVVGVDEQTLASGLVVRSPDRERLREQLAVPLARGVRSLAVALKNAYRNPANELAVAAVAEELGFELVALSHVVAREINLTARGDTTTADAYLTPILRRYVDRFRSAMSPDVTLRFMQSSGGLADALAFSGKDAILSGPAGGVVACAHVAKLTGHSKVIGFDMGGTSTDVSRLDLAEGFERVYERTIAGVRIKAPMLAVNTIAAGGGSCLSFDGRRLTVGPESAGADPGPVCYRRADGELALTDANVVLGRVQPELFPACFGSQADQPLDAERARTQLSALAREVSRASGVAHTAESLAAGFVRIANDTMASAIREISVARGYDVSEYALLCFGGAGAQHACAVASGLGVRTVIIHPAGGVLSAYGMGLADVVHTDVEPLLVPLDVGVEPLALAARGLETRGRAAVVAQGVGEERIRFVHSADLRYRGVDGVINVRRPADALAPAAWAAAFESQHLRLFGFVRPGHPLELANARLETIGATDAPPEASGEVCEHQLTSQDALRVTEVHFDSLDPDGVRRLDRLSAPVFQRGALKPGATIAGPAIITEAVSTIVVDPGWTVRVDATRNLVMAASTGAKTERVGTRRDPVFLEIVGNLYMSIAEQMGATLRRVSLSVNIKERLDFSCAVFDALGQLVANAPHIPVHLGAMGESVRAILSARGADLRPGDVLATNDPYAGGSHLPDITVITPVFAASGVTPAFFVANRGHHADVGGVVPGSMPPFSRTIDEEGVRLHDVLLVRGGRFLRAELEGLLSAGPHPVRGIPERLADLEAQVAANAVGARLLNEMTARYGLEVVCAYMGHVLDDAAAAMEEAISALPDGRTEFFDHLDEGARIQVAITIAGPRATVDFTGTDASVAGNLNAPRAVVLAAVLYVFRTLISRPIPLNAGCLRPLEVIIPEGSLLDPRPPAAVVGGNVETSQRIVDVLYGALGNLGASQGTMNNLTFGGEEFGYYETICGGAGAGLGFDGAAAVHTHMTNTRITDPEVLELRYPVVLRRFAVRRGTGGAGVFRGGDGVVREIEFLAPMQAAILSERRAVRPYGAHGASPGELGRNVYRQRDPSGALRSIHLPGKVRLAVSSGDRLEIHTPGGGGYNPTPSEWAALRPAQARRLFREGRHRGPTSGISLGHAQANLVVLPSQVADAFEAYCRLNPDPCPLLERLEAGHPEPRLCAAGADLRFDLPGYRLYTRGGHQELLDLREAWDTRCVAFLVGCSFSTEEALLAAGIPVRHVEERKNVPMYRTRRRTRTAGPFGGALVVSMRPMPRALCSEARRICAPYWHGHGGPVHVGDSAALGIADLSRPDWGDAVSIHPGEVPVFWACGVTTQVAIEHALAAGAFERAMTHAPGHMFIGDLTNAELLALNFSREGGLPNANV